MDTGGTVICFSETFRSMTLFGIHAIQFVGAQASQVNKEVIYASVSRKFDKGSRTFNEFEAVPAGHALRH